MHHKIQEEWSGLWYRRWWASLDLNQNLIGYCVKDDLPGVSCGRWAQELASLMSLPGHSNGSCDLRAFAKDSEWTLTLEMEEGICRAILGRTDAEAEAPILWPPDAKNQLIWKDPDAGKDWRRKEKGMTEDEMVGWHHWLKGHAFQ